MSYDEQPDAPLHGECAAEIHRPEQQRDELAAQVEATNALMDELLDQLGERTVSDGNAPGHGHEIPGVWDSDNGALAGKPCAWCATWAHAKALRVAPNTAAAILRQRDARTLRDAAEALEVGECWISRVGVGMALRRMADELESKNG